MRFDAGWGYGTPSLTSLIVTDPVVITSKDNRFSATPLDCQLRFWTSRQSGVLTHSGIDQPNRDGVLNCSGLKERVTPVSFHWTFSPCQTLHEFTKFPRVDRLE